MFIGGESIGVMDPIRNFGETTPITINDLLALDVFGYKISDFNLESPSSKLTVRQGESSEITVKINRDNGYNGLVTVFPADTKGLNIKLSKKVETTQTSASFKLKIKKNATLGEKELEFVAQDEAGRKRTTKIILEIQ